MGEFKKYARTNIAEMMVYEDGSILSNRVSISKTDLENGSPKAGDMIARNPDNHEDMWLVAKEYFEDNFKPISTELDKEDPGFEIKFNKLLRQELDASLQRLKNVKGSRERSLSITKLQEAIMWLGMDLKRLNEPNPYPHSYDPSNTKISKTADNLEL